VKLKCQFWIVLKWLWKMEHLLIMSKCSIFQNHLQKESSTGVKICGVKGYQVNWNHYFASHFLWKRAFLLLQIGKCSYYLRLWYIHSKLNLYPSHKLFWCLCKRKMTENFVGNRSFDYKEQILYLRHNNPIKAFFFGLDISSFSSCVFLKIAYRWLVAKKV